MSESDTLIEMSIVLGRITDIMDNHPSDYKMARDAVAKAREKVADSPSKALKQCNKAYRYALGESLAVIRFEEIIGDADIDDFTDDKLVKELYDKYTECIDRGEYDDAVAVAEKIGKKIKGSIPPQILTIVALNYTVPDSDPVIEFSVSNVSDRSAMIETLVVQPSYCHISEYPGTALFSGDSTSFKIKLDCPEGRFPLTYTLTYTVNMERLVKRGTMTAVIEEIDD